MNRSARLAVTCLAASMAITATGACGVSPDDSPRTLARSATSQPRREAAGEGATTAFLYFVENGKIVTASRDVPERTPAAVLTALFDDLTDDDRNAELISQIPTGTSLLSAERDESTLTIDLSKEFDNLVGTARGQAAAQIVYTATEVGGIEQVVFHVDGKPSKVFSPSSGDTSTVGPCDFVSLLASNDDMRVDKLASAAVRHIAALRTTLADDCAHRVRR